MSGCVISGSGIQARFLLSQFQGQSFKDGFENVVHFRVHVRQKRKDLSDTEAMEFVDKRLLFVAVNLLTARNNGLPREAAAATSISGLSVRCARRLRE